MRVKHKNGKIQEVNKAYGARLVEQGKAVVAPAKKKAEKPKETKAGE